MYDPCYEPASVKCILDKLKSFQTQHSYPIINWDDLDVPVFQYLCTWSSPNSFYTSPPLFYALKRFYVGLMAR